MVGIYDKIYYPILKRIRNVHSIKLFGVFTRHGFLSYFVLLYLSCMCMRLNGKPYVV